MEVTSSPVTDPPAAEQPRRRRHRRRSPARARLADRVSMPTVIGLVAALLVFVLVALVLRDRREMVDVAVTTERVPAGAAITESMVERSEVPASVGFADGLVHFDELGPSTVATRTLQPGEAIPRSAIGGREQTSGARVMAIPVESWQAAGGELDVGDQVDVIDTGDGGPRYVLSGAAVVGRSVDDSSGGLGASSSNELWISVEVDAAEALELSAVITGGDFVLVRSTGADDSPGRAPPASATAAQPPGTASVPEATALVPPTTVASADPGASPTTVVTGGG